MHPVIYLNKIMVEATKARVAPVSSAMLYGRGVFTTLAIHHNKPFLWPRHWRRLAAHAAKLDVNLDGLTEKNVGDALQKLISVNQVPAGRARVILLARSGRDIWKAKMPGARKTDLLILTSEVQQVSQNGLSLAVSPYSREEAQKRDFDEAVMLNERGEIVSATMANIFWAKAGTVHTPTLSSGALAGITRECVIELAAKHYIPLVEGVYEMPDLIEADEIFLTSSGLGVAPVTTFDFRRYSIETGSIVATIANAFSKFIGKDPH